MFYQLNPNQFKCQQPSSLSYAMFTDSFTIFCDQKNPKQKTPKTPQQLNFLIKNFFHQNMVYRRWK